MSLPVQVCAACGRRAFPPHLLCAGCGGRDFATEQADRGVLEEATSVHRVPGRTLEEPVRVATIRVGELRVVARLESDARAGDEVALSLDQGAPVGR